MIKVLSQMPHLRGYLCSQSRTFSTANNKLTDEMSSMMKNVMNQYGLSNTLQPQLPNIKLPYRSIIPGDLTMPKKNIYQMIGYKQIERQPRCNSFSVEYRGRIYRVFDAQTMAIGRIINTVCSAIRGRFSPHYRNNQFNPYYGDICIIVNIQDPLLTGNKLKYKSLKYHPNFVGHLKTHSYRSVLNKKPQLLYYYLLRRAMPKNKLSEKYFCNLKLYRGPTHDLSYLPQFAPQKQKIEPLVTYDPAKHLAQNPDEYVLLQSNDPDKIKNIMKDGRGVVQSDFSSSDLFDDIDLTKLSTPTPKRPFVSKGDDHLIQRMTAPPAGTHIVPTISSKKAQKLLQKRQKILKRYVRLNAPYRDPVERAKIGNPRKHLSPSVDSAPGFHIFQSEKEARKSEMYKQIVDEEIPEEDEHVYKDPWTESGLFVTPKKADSNTAGKDAKAGKTEPSKNQKGK